MHLSVDFIPRIKIRFPADLPPASRATIPPDELYTASLTLACRKSTH